MRAGGGSGGPSTRPAHPTGPAALLRGRGGRAASVRLARGPQQPPAHPRRPSTRRAGTAPALASRPAHQPPLGPSTGAGRRGQRGLPGTPLPPLRGSETLWGRPSQARSGRASREDGAGGAVGGCAHTPTYLVPAGSSQELAGGLCVRGRSLEAGFDAICKSRRQEQSPSGPAAPGAQARGPQQGGRHLPLGGHGGPGQESRPEEQGLQGWGARSPAWHRTHGLAVLLGQGSRVGKVPWHLGTDRSPGPQTGGRASCPPGGVLPLWVRALPWGITGPASSLLLSPGAPGQGVCNPTTWCAAVCCLVSPGPPPSRCLEGPRRPGQLCRATGPSALPGLAPGSSAGAAPKCLCFGDPWPGLRS